MSSELVSVIIPAYNAAATIEPCIEALRAQRYDQASEIIVIDDGSTDMTAACAEAAGASVLRIPRGRPAAARNAGIRAASGAIICCTDADCIPAPDWLSQITLPFRDDTIIACKGSYTSAQTEWVARFVQLEYEDKYDLLRSQVYIDFIDTYSAAYRRDVLLANGGFDERFTYLEDQELSFRLAARGYRMVFQESAVVQHLHSASLSAYLRKKMTIGYWKAQVVRRFPGQIMRDSHTPQIMKVQMLLMALLLPALALGCAYLIRGRFVFGENRWLSLVPALVIAMVFLLTTLPFVIKAWPKDRPVALFSPLFLALRALGLGSGYLWGVLRPHTGVQDEVVIAGLPFYLKRGMDIFGAFAGLLFTLITWPLWALMIKLDSHGPVLFRQERIGIRGRPFTLYKFRSMHVDAAERWPELMATYSLNEPVLKLAEDPRLTGVGRFLRRWSIDELPQFWNVLKGEMSLVGPRPEEPRVVAYYQDWHRRRLSVKPGLTGPMQVNGRADLSLDERVRLDIDYIEQYSIRKDLAILLKTIPVVIRGKGAR